MGVGEHNLNVLWITDHNWLDWASVGLHAVVVVVFVWWWRWINYNLHCTPMHSLQPTLSLITIYVDQHERSSGADQSSTIISVKLISSGSLVLLLVAGHSVDHNWPDCGGIDIQWPITVAELWWRRKRSCAELDDVKMASLNYYLLDGSNLVEVS